MTRERAGAGAERLKTELEKKRGIIAEVVDEYLQLNGSRHMIGRVWHGWTTLQNAEAYERLLKEKIFPSILAKGVEGYRGIELLRREGHDEEVEFKTIMWFDSLVAVREFAGEDYVEAYVPTEARALLSRFDAQSQHYEIRARLKY